MSKMAKRIIVVLIAALMFFSHALTAVEAKGRGGRRPQPTPEPTVEPTIDEELIIEVDETQEERKSFLDGLFKKKEKKPEEKTEPDMKVPVNNRLKYEEEGEQAPPSETPLPEETVNEETAPVDEGVLSITDNTEKEVSGDGKES